LKPRINQGGPSVLLFFEINFNFYLHSHFFIRTFDKNIYDMKLTVHLTGVEKTKFTEETKSGPVMKSKVFNTLTFHDIAEGDVSRILSDIESEKKGTVAKHSLSGDKQIGRAFCKKK
jgi:hypothetical protein